MKILLSAIGIMGFLGWLVLAFGILFMADIDTPPAEVVPMGVLEYLTVLFPLAYFAFYTYSALARMDRRILLVSGIAMHLLALANLFVFFGDDAFMGGEVPLKWALGFFAAFLSIVIIWFRTLCHRSPLRCAPVRPVP